MIYFDTYSTTKTKPEVINYAIDIINNQWMNPNSMYHGGQEAKNIIEEARRIVASKINASSQEIVFCPSASAANALAIVGYLKKHNLSSFVTTNIEHDSILLIDEYNNLTSFKEKCDLKGLLSSKQFEKYKNTLVSVMGVNNEIGTIQPIRQIAKTVHKNNCVFHSDLTQYISHIPVDVKELDLDMATFSAHKIGGLRGCAVLYVKDGVDLSPIVYGTQENGMFGGTQNTVAIASLGKAIELLNYKNKKRIMELRDYALSRLFAISSDIKLNGCFELRAPDNINICIKGIDGQSLLYYLDLHGVYCSAGSACNSSVNKPSYVLKAIGLSDEDAYSSIRITLNEAITYSDIDTLCDHIYNFIKMYKNKVGGEIIE